MKNSASLSWPFQLRQLAVMIDAGISIEAALGSLAKRRDRASVKLQRAKGLVVRGVSLPDALQRARIIDQFDHAVLSSADAAGSLADGLNHISERRVNQVQRVESFNASLIFPKAIVVMGVFAGMFVRTAAGEQSILEACIAVGGIAFLFYVIAYISVMLMKADTRIWMSLFWPYPLIRRCSQWHKLALEYFLYNSFIWQISSGVAAGSAARNCRHLLNSHQFRHSVASAADAMEAGESITQALMNQGLVMTKRMQQVLLVSDQSGTHEAAIKKELALQRIDLKQKADNFFKWAPRVYYLIALLFTSKLMTI